MAAHGLVNGPLGENCIHLLKKVASIQGEPDRDATTKVSVKPDVDRKPETEKTQERPGNTPAAASASSCRPTFQLSRGVVFGWGRFSALRLFFNYPREVMQSIATPRHAQR
ncbi:hypothetical protein [Bosea sp. TAF32]|uniref:hypothetical protein n=1 Tax=Bosea sp. TAF32 TaxID=3237482 RepID=UPI003F914681